MAKAVEKIKEEFLKMLPPMTTAYVAIAALVLGKAVLFADTLPAINRFPDKPHVHNIGWSHSWALQIVLLLLILIHVITTEMARVLGRDRLRRIFFGPLPRSAA
jgi:hypothetical protein